MIPAPRSLRAATLLLLLASACSSNRPAEAEVHPWFDSTEIESNDGTWRVVYRVEGGAIRRGENVEIDAWVFDSGTNSADPGAAPRADVSLAVDAAMPQHGHGMNRVPRIENLGAGRFRIEGLLFHMPGKWELYFDVARGPLVERAQTDVEVE